MSPGVDPNLRAQIRAKILADYGAHTMLPGNKMPRPRRLPIDSPALNYITAGGVPFAHMTRMWGAWSSGKTTALMKMFAAAQNFGQRRYAQLMGLAELSLAAGEHVQAKYLKDLAKREREMGALSCLFVLAEKSFDPAMPTAVGVDLSKLEIVTESKIEVIGDIVQQALGGYHVVGVDSTTSTISIDELGHKDGIYGALPMLRAARWGINMDWWRDRLSPDNCIIFTSQVSARLGGRASIGQQVAESPPGGHKLFHEPGLILHFMKSSPLKRKANGGLEEVGEDARGSASASAFSKFQASGGMVVVKCDKNKVGVQGRAAVLHHDKRTSDFDPLWEYEKFASYFRVLAKSGTWWVLPDGTKTQQLRSTLQASPELRTSIDSVVLRCAEDAEYEARLLAGNTGALVEVASESA